MAAEVQTRMGECPTHGSVQATREIPRFQFPIVVYGVLRLLSKRRPYRCPLCDSEVTPT